MLLFCFPDKYRQKMFQNNGIMPKNEFLSIPGHTEMNF